jgi:hypothetical protein
VITTKQSVAERKRLPRFFQNLAMTSIEKPNRHYDGGTTEVICFKKKKIATVFPKPRNDENRETKPSLRRRTTEVICFKRMRLPRFFQNLAMTRIEKPNRHYEGGTTEVICFKRMRLPQFFQNFAMTSKEKPNRHYEGERQK